MSNGDGPDTSTNSDQSATRNRWIFVRFGAVLEAWWWLKVGGRTKTRENAFSVPLGGMSHSGVDYVICFRS